jgi:hypothetical protein
LSADFHGSQLHGLSAFHLDGNRLWRPCIRGERSKQRSRGGGAL